jgi:hypothetical protein
MTTGDRRPRGESPWVAAVYDDVTPGPLGTGAVIDNRRVVTCAHVCSGLIGGQGEPKRPLWVDFPMVDGPADSRRRRVILARLSDECDVAVLYLAEHVPAGVRAAPLRRPKSSYLRGSGWWAFGFPKSQNPRRFYTGRVPGDGANGVVGDALGDGHVRLDIEGPQHVQHGFSGGGLWSPDYEAVVGVVTHWHPNGGGVAVTMHEADRCFGEGSLAALTDWSAEQAGELALSDWGWSMADDPQYGPHWRPRARGVAVDREGGYRFRGRRAALDKIIGWLGREHTDPTVLVVTGSPGAGKSAVLGRVITSADPRVRAELPADGVARAVEGSVACAVHAKGKTALDVAKEIARAASAAHGHYVPLDPLTGRRGWPPPAPTRWCGYGIRSLAS